MKTVFILLPGNDTVYLDVETGEVTSGPIVAGTDIDISVQFFTESGTPDSRVTELAYRMDITPADAGIVTFTRSTAFAGTLHKVSPGVTSMSLALVQLSDTSTLFARGIPVEIY